MWKFQMSKASHIWPNHGFTPYRKNIRTLLREEFKKKKRTQPKHDWWGTIKKKMMNGKKTNMTRSGDKYKNNELEREYDDKMIREQRILERT